MSRLLLGLLAGAGAVWALDACTPDNNLLCGEGLHDENSTCVPDSTGPGGGSGAAGTTGSSGVGGSSAGASAGGSSGAAQAGQGGGPAGAGGTAGTGGAAGQSGTGGTAGMGMAGTNAAGTNAAGTNAAGMAGTNAAGKSGSAGTAGAAGKGGSAGTAGAAGTSAGQAGSAGKGGSAGAAGKGGSAGSGGSGQSADDVCATVGEGETAKLMCPDGQEIKAVTFASYGTATGECGSFKKGSCDSDQSVSKVSEACVGKQSCEVVASNATFGEPCSGMGKNLRVAVTCGAP